MRKISIIALMVGLSIAADAAQDFEPELNRLNHLALTKNASSDHLFARSALATNFDRTQRIDPTKLAGQYAGCQPLFLRTYEQSPESLASDISAAIADNNDLPASIRTALLVADGQAPRANQTAKTWLDDLLNPNKNDVVGVILLMRPEAGKEPTLHWLLARGTATKNGTILISHIVYGAAAEALQ